MVVIVQVVSNLFAILLAFDNELGCFEIQLGWNGILGAVPFRTAGSAIPPFLDNLIYACVQRTVSFNSVKLSYYKLPGLWLLNYTRLFLFARTDERSSVARCAAYFPERFDHRR